MEKSKKIKKYIITDPCYIMDEKQYHDICYEQSCDFEGQSFPLKSKRRDDGVDIVFHIIDGTPNGDGSYEFRGQEIGVDAGMLCVAFCEEGWEDEDWGATSSTLESALKNFPYILSRF